MICYTVNNFCCEDISLIENYEKAINDTKTWDCHHRLETELNLSASDLIKKGMYYNRPASELIFLTHSEHNSLHHKNKIPSDETRQKISEANKDKPKSEEHRKKISNSLKNKPKSEEHRKKISNSLKNKQISEEYRKNLSEAMKQWWAKRKLENQK